MVSRALILLFLPAIYARIHIEIAASSKNEHNEARAFGSSVDIISNLEIKTFELYDDNLKQAVDSYFGKRPDDAYLKSPTPFGDLYSSYNWPQVQRTLMPRSAKILSVTSQPSIVSSHLFENNSTTKAEYQAAISQEVSNTVSNSWEKGGELTIGQEIEYEVDLESLSLGGKTSLEFTSSWGESTSKSETVTVGSKSGVTINLEPGQKVIAELQATRGSMKIQVDYEATLAGAVAVNYGTPYKGHHFWKLDVNAVMAARSLPKTVRSTEVIELLYYSDSRVLIRDLDTKKMMYSIPI